MDADTVTLRLRPNGEILIGDNLDQVLTLQSPCVIPLFKGSRGVSIDKDGNLLTFGAKIIDKEFILIEKDCQGHNAINPSSQLYLEYIKYKISKE